MKYGLIGEKLSHSFSKEIHENLADYKYELCEIARNELASFLEKREFCAINVTMPYKQSVISHLDFISDTARELDSVNTIVNRDGKLYGYNTDYFGLRDLILKNGVDVSGKKVLVLGTGGTARTASVVCSNLGAKEIHLVSREEKPNSITYDEAYALHNDADIIINATPCGMYPDNYSCPINIEKFTNIEALFDAIYNPLSTPLVQMARKNGIIAEGGLYMLVSQAVYAVEFFLDTKIDKEKVNEIYQKIIHSKENIVLIGMPSCGKTTVGGILALDLHRELFDLDDEIEKHIGTTIAKYFENHTEKDFRDIETLVTKEISKKSGIIVATGGGCILRGENVDALKQNGRLYFLDRSLDALTPTDSRPLATDKEKIKNLYFTRKPIYESVCDAKISCDTDVQSIATIIGKDFQKCEF